MGGVERGATAESHDEWFNAGDRQRKSGPDLRVINGERTTKKSGAQNAHRQIPDSASFRSIPISQRGRATDRGRSMMEDLQRFSGGAFPPVEQERQQREIPYSLEISDAPADVQREGGSAIVTGNGIANIISEERADKLQRSKGIFKKMWAGAGALLRGLGTRARSFVAEQLRVTAEGLAVDEAPATKIREAIQRQQESLEGSIEMSDELQREFGGIVDNIMLDTNRTHYLEDDEETELRTYLLRLSRDQSFLLSVHNRYDERSRKSGNKSELLKKILGEVAKEHADYFLSTIDQRTAEEVSNEIADGWLNLRQAQEAGKDRDAALAAVQIRDALSRLDPRIDPGVSQLLEGVFGPDHAIANISLLRDWFKDPNNDVKVLGEIRRHKGVGNFSGKIAEASIRNFREAPPATQRELLKALDRSPVMPTEMLERWEMAGFRMNLALALGAPNKEKIVRDLVQSLREEEGLKKEVGQEMLQQLQRGIMVRTPDNEIWMIVDHGTDIAILDPEQRQRYLQEQQKNFAPRFRRERTKKNQASPRIEEVRNVFGLSPAREATAGARDRMATLNQVSSGGFSQPQRYRGGALASTTRPTPGSLRLRNEDEFFDVQDAQARGLSKEQNAREGPENVNIEEVIQQASAVRKQKKQGDNSLGDSRRNAFTRSLSPRVVGGPGSTHRF